MIKRVLLCYASLAIEVIDCKFPIRMVFFVSEVTRKTASIYIEYQERIIASIKRFRHLPHKNLKKIF